VVQTGWQGQFPLRVLDGEGRTIARTELLIREPRPCHWQTFAELRREELGGDAVRFDYRVARDAIAAVPDLPGLTSILPPAGWEVKAAQSEKRAGENLLPGAVPLHPAWAEIYGGKPDEAKVGKEYFPLELAFDGKAFVVDGRGRKLTDWAERHLLARWWVNGVPVVAKPREQRQKMQQQARQVRDVAKLSIGFALPEVLGALREGDKVALQVMYVPDEYEELEDPRAARARELKAQRLRADGPMVPLLSNRVEWEMRKDLIEAARP
jgi:hypothetical protein